MTPLLLCVYSLFYLTWWRGNESPFWLQEGVTLAHNDPNLSMGLPNGLQMAPIDPNYPKMAPKGYPRYCMNMVSAIVHNFGGFRPFWVRKRSKISPNMSSIACYWASKCTQFCPEWPQNDSKMTPTLLYSCSQYYCLLFGGIQVIFGWRGWNQSKTLDFDNWHCMVS